MIWRKNLLGCRQPNFKLSLQSNVVLKQQPQEGIVRVTHPCTDTKAYYLFYRLAAMPWKHWKFYLVFIGDGTTSNMHSKKDFFEAWFYCCRCAIFSNRQEYLKTSTFKTPFFKPSYAQISEILSNILWDKNAKELLITVAIPLKNSRDSCSRKLAVQMQ